jgi:hypothetical protein
VSFVTAEEFFSFIEPPPERPHISFHLNLSPSSMPMPGALSQTGQGDQSISDQQATTQATTAQQSSSTHPPAYAQLCTQAEQVLPVPPWQSLSSQTQSQVQSQL